MTSNRPILYDPCEKGLKDFKHLEKNVFHCSSCDKSVTDISNLDDVDYFDYQGKCIVANYRQLDDMRMIHPLKRFAVAAFLIFGSSLFLIPESYGQTKATDIVVHQTSERAISGRIVGSRGYGISDATVTLKLKDCSTIKVQTDSYGDFLIELPRGKELAEIELTIEYQKGAKNYNKTIKETLQPLMMNDLGNVKLKVKQYKRRFRRRSSGVAAYF